MKTTTNTVYEVIKQRGQGGRMEDDYAVINSPSGGPPPDIDVKYDIVSSPAPHQPLPPLTSSNAEEVEGMYECIPGDK